MKKLRFLEETFRFAALLALALFLTGAMADQPGSSGAQRLIAIGDLHGDYNAFRTLMIEAGLIDQKGRWRGGKATIVQMGDVVDRGSNSRDIVLHLQRLQREAARAGGKVVVLIGNHEAMNMIGDLRYVPLAEYKNYITPRSKATRERVYQAYKRDIEESYRRSSPEMSDAEIKARWLEQTPLGWAEHRLAWAPDGAFGRWVISNPAAAIIGDNLFVHGGISVKYAAYSVDQLNDMIHAALKTAAKDDDAVLEDELGPLWYRGLVAENESSAAEVSTALKTHGVKRIIIGHTPNLSGIKVLHEGRVILIDTGITSVYGGTHSFLSIEGSMIRAHDNGIVTELGAATTVP